MKIRKNVLVNYYNNLPKSDFKIKWKKKVINGDKHGGTLYYNLL